MVLQDKLGQQSDEKSMPKFTVLLSLYSPNLDFLSIQLESIKNQISVDIRLVVRLDGFDKDLFDWLNEFLKVREFNFEVLVGNRIGACASYFELIRHIENYDYVAFSDQDDYWKDSKLISSVHSSENLGPLLTVVGMQDFKFDWEIPYIINTKKELSRGISTNYFGNALVENVFQGARMTLNKSAVTLIKNSIPVTENVIMHDAWIYLVIAGIGRVQEIEEISFFYRQHEANLIGLRSGSFVNRLKRVFSKTSNQRFLMAREYSKLFPDSDLAKTAKAFSEILNRPRYCRVFTLSSMNLRRARKLDLLLFYLLVSIK